MRIDHDKVEMCLAKSQLTVKDFCTKCSLDKKTLRAAYSTGVRPSTVGRIAAALEVEIEDIIAKEKDASDFGETRAS